MSRAKRRGKPLGSALGLAALGLLVACHQHVAFDENGCDEDWECGLTTLHCDTAAATCVECTNDDHCAALGIARIRCDTAVHRCVECGLDADCGQGRGCHGHHCVTLCNIEGANGSCPSAAPYCEADDLGFCVQCGDDLPHACDGGAVAGPICGRLGLCQACQVDGDCKAPTARCETFDGRCVACVDSKDCTGGTVCDPVTNRCLPPQQ